MRHTSLYCSIFGWLFNNSEIPFQHLEKGTLIVSQPCGFLTKLMEVFIQYLLDNCHSVNTKSLYLFVVASYCSVMLMTMVVILHQAFTTTKTGF